MVRMSIFTGRLGLALVLAASCLGGPTASAQTAPVQYWIPDWPLGFGNLTAGQGADTYGNFPSFDGSGFSSSRYDFPDGLFVGGERGAIGLGGLGQTTAFGSLYSEGTQFGYNFKNAGVTVYGGFDTLTYDPGIGAPLAPFSAMSGTLPAYGAHAGVEFRPSSNVSLSLGFGYTQQGRADTDSTLPSLSGKSPYALVGH